MAITLSKDERSEALTSIERYFRENMEAPIGNIAAIGLLGFFLEEIGPAIYNRAVADAQERLAQRVADLNYDVYEETFPYWRKYERTPRKRT
ncbi:DUF2164 domain-containing protein [Chitinolyticbacter albus]|uniref:DUF2164 domain-containing protein n=1 Tax=Chitinolyticbacter albus TaxID=2961951 RepID=UPI00210900ED|nr:DUF2164 domain-containing protein [Chitinolyticbacter albus]